MITENDRSSPISFYSLLQLFSFFLIEHSLNVVLTYLDTFASGSHYYIITSKAHIHF